MGDGRLSLPIPFREHWDFWKNMGVCVCSERRWRKGMESEAEVTHLDQKFFRRGGKESRKGRKGSKQDKEMQQREESWLKRLGGPRLDVSSYWK